MCWMNFFSFCRELESVIFPQQLSHSRNYNNIILINNHERAEEKNEREIKKKKERNKKRRLHPS